jgi:hypothetical protein
VFVRYHSERLPTTSAKSLLCKVKYREDLRQHWTVYRPKFRAAQRYARQHGWRFRLVTERHVRTPYLDNVKFLRPYRVLPVNDQHQSQLLNSLRGLREAEPATLLAAVSQDRWHQAQLLSTLWQLVATRQIHTDLGQPLTMQSRLWLKELR